MTMIDAIKNLLQGMRIGLCYAISATKGSKYRLILIILIIIQIPLSMIFTIILTILGLSKWYEMALLEADPELERMINEEEH